MARNNAPASAPSPEQLAQANFAARNLVLQAGVPRLQQIYSKGQNPANGNIVTINPNNVGLIRGFLVKVTGTMRNNDAAKIAARTPFGALNVLSNVQFTDMDNTIRINTSGYHLGMLNSAKQPLVLGGAYATNVPIGFGNNWDVMTAAATIPAAGADVEVQQYYYVPLAYTKLDLRGAMWAGIVNATSQLQLTINANPVVDAGDLTGAVYSNAGGVDTGWKADTNVTITVWQDYIDQVPMSQGNPILPMQDLGQIYDIKNTALQGLVPNQDFGIPYANFRSFLSTLVVINNGVAPFLNVGEEINYWALRAANASELFKYGPEEAAFLARSIFAADPPKGMYYFSHRDRPITTQQFGNMELIVNPNANINQAASALVGFESFAQLNQVTFASSLPNS